MIGQAKRLIELNNLALDKSVKKLKKIYAFSSGKGGTGKTFLSLNLAYAISRQNKKVLVIDLDANLSNANILLDVVATKTIYNFFTGIDSLKEIITEVETNFDFIFGDSGKTNYPNLTDNIVNKFFTQLAILEQEYDYIFLDLGAGADEQIFNFLLLADYNIIVTTPEPTSLMDAYVVLKLLKFRKYIGQKLVIINKCKSESEGENTLKNLQSASEHFLKEKINCLGFISEDPTVNESIISQNLLTKYSPQSKISHQISRLAKQLFEFKHLANILHEK